MLTNIWASKVANEFRSKSIYLSFEQLRNVVGPTLTKRFLLQNKASSEGRLRKLGSVVNTPDSALGKGSKSSDTVVSMGKFVNVNESSVMNKLFPK
jgi:hypothetical protein